ncbi:MAG: hypothetical protein IJN17_06650 [Clostridia bacterium]|nr:hypothetical protein [Clostridia bacterium]
MLQIVICILIAIIGVLLIGIVLGKKYAIEFSIPLIMLLLFYIFAITSYCVNSIGMAYMFLWALLFYFVIHVYFVIKFSIIKKNIMSTVAIVGIMIFVLRISPCAIRFPKDIMFYLELVGYSFVMALLHIPIILVIKFIHKKALAKSETISPKKDNPTGSEEGKE